MEIVSLDAPGRFPTVVPETLGWWYRLRAQGRHQLRAFGLNHHWWRAACAPDVVHTLSEDLSEDSLVDRFGPRGSMLASATKASRALASLSSIATFENARAYRRAVAAILDHLVNLDSAQHDFRTTLELGPVARGIDLGDSIHVARHAEAPSALRRLVARALDTLSGAPDLFAFRVSSGVDLLNAAIAASLLRTRFPDAHLALVDHSYENFSLKPHLGSLRRSGNLTRLFDTIVASKDDVETAVPDLVARLARGERPAGILEGAPAPLSLPAPEPADDIPALFPTFAPFPVPHVRLSARRCYWSRCTFCVQNAKYDDPLAPSRSEVAASVDRLAALARRGLDNVILSDEAVSPASLRLLSTEIVRRAVAIRWTCRCKLERSFSRELIDLAAAAGCYEILFGLETISEPLQKRMGKHVEGLDAAATARIFADLEAAGIGIHVNLISGFPGESRAEADATIAFVVDSLRRHRNATTLLNRFTVFPATPIATDPAAFGIARLDGRGDMPSRYRHEFDAATRARTEPVVRAFATLERRLAKGLGWSARRRSAAGRAVADLYASSGHGAVFKTLRRNPLDPVVSAAEPDDRPAALPPPRRPPAGRMRVLLTGASGNAGHAIRSVLLDQGHEVVALLRDAADDDGACEVVVGDLRDGRGLSEAARGADAIVHCASPRSLDWREVASVEIDGLARLLDAWHRGPFVTMSSQTVYGVPDRRLAENAPLRPGTWYDHGKLACESLLAMEAGRGARGMGIAFRLPLLFGAGPRRRSGQFLPAVVDALRRGDRFVFTDPGAARRHGTVYIGDRDLGLATIAALGLDRGGPYNIASGFVSWRTLLDTLGAALGVAPRTVFRVDDGVRGADEFRLPRSRTAYDCRRFQSRAGFEPSEGLLTILERFLDADASRSTVNASGE